jgi:hypothetical protein
MTKIKNILLIGRTGSGKSTLGNILSNSNEFVETNVGTSETKKVKFLSFELEIGQEKVKYRVIDTVGIGDDQLNIEEVLYRLGESQFLIEEDGLNQIFFMVNGRIGREGIEAFKLLNSVIFDYEAVKYTTMIRTNFSEFEDEDACERDSRKLREAHPEFKSVKMVHIDNPQPKGRYARIAEESRAESRKRLITHLGSVSHLNYQSSVLLSMKERFKDYVSDEGKFKELEEEMKDLKLKEEERGREMERLEQIRREEMERVKREFEESERRREDELWEEKQRMEVEIEAEKVKMEEERERERAEERERIERLREEFEQRQREAAEESKENIREIRREAEERFLQEQQARRQEQQAQLQNEALRGIIELGTAAAAAMWRI